MRLQETAQYAMEWADHTIKVAAFEGEYQGVHANEYERFEEFVADVKAAVMKDATKYAEHGLCDMEEEMLGTTDMF